MIDRKEIEEKAKEFEIHPSNVERDYVFGWILFGLFTIGDLKDQIFLKGGNALRKGYFENTRFSTDLDFGIPGDIDQGTLLKEINNICDFIQDKAGIDFVKENNRVDEKFTATDAPIPNLRVYEVLVYFKDFYGNPDKFTIKISMDITRFDRVLLPIQKVKLIHPYSDFGEVECKISCMKLEEVIATKLKCLLQRQHAPDLFDYAYSIKLLGGTLDKKEVVDALVRKTIFSRNPQILKDILKQTPFDYFKNCWGVAVICAKQFIVRAEDAISLFLGDLDDLFSIYGDSGYTQFVYFGPQFRVPIMKAGREQTLLKIIYKGEERLVEPYSLKYQEKKDGSEREYFYAYKLEGGSSGHGMKRFLAEGMESVDNTDTKFNPRFQIELCKSGERPDNPYLFDPNKPSSSPRNRKSTRITRMSASSYGPKYIYQCGYCGKKFTRKLRSSTIKPHKDKQGYSCSGRHGHYVDTKY